MRTLYESILDNADVIFDKTDKQIKQLKLIKDIGLWEINPISSGGNLADWLKSLKIETDYTSIFEPYVKKQKNWFNKYSKDYSGLVGIILNILLKVKKLHKKIHVWDWTSNTEKPSGLKYIEEIFKKQYNRDIYISCADMLDGNNIVIRLEICDIKSQSYIYIYFEEDKFNKFIN